MTLPREDVSGFVSMTDERARIADYLVRQVEETLGEAGGFLAQTSAYVLSSPGKLVRPLLLLDACRAAGGDPELAFPAALGTEYGHIASLIHDDIIDGDRERHGQETLHARYNLAAALLTGDFFIFHTFLSYTYCYDQGVSAERVLAAIRTLSMTCIEVCQGQALEATLAGKLDTTAQAYLEMICLKTASVCRAAAGIGAQLGGAAEDIIVALSRYGENMGMAFQIIDDVLSYDGTAAVVGKPLRSDMANGRVTLPIIMALQSEDPGVRQRIHLLFEGYDTGPEGDGHAQLVQILRSTRALDRARAFAYRYITRAKHDLDLLPYSEARDRLRALADIVVSRDH